MNDIPTIRELYAMILAQLESEFNTTIPLVGKSYLRAQAAVLASMLRLFYLFGGKIQKNIFPDLADSIEFGGTLERFGDVKLNRARFPATAGVYTIELTGQLGAQIPANTTFKSDDDNVNPGFLFILDSAYVMPGTTGEIQVRALTAGLESKLFISETLTATQPLNAIENQAVVSSEDIEPQSGETIEEYRLAILRAFRIQAQGGAQADYVLWGTEVQSVAAIYPYAAQVQTNTVVCYIEAILDDSIDGKGTPSAQIIDDVRESIEEPTSDRPARIPLGTEAIYEPIVPLDVDIRIINYVDITPEKQTLIQNALTDFLSTVRPFLSGVDVVGNRNDQITLNNISAVILEAVPGSIFDFPEMDVNGSPQTNYTFENGDIPYLNSIMYV